MERRKKMKRKLRGFSLAELLISLLIISIALSAAIPTLTRRSSASREFIWRWSNENNSAYFGVGSNQSAIIGAETIPLKDSNLDTILSDDEVNIGNAKFSNTGDKLLLVKKTVYLGAGNTNPSDFANSHISFYNAANGASATTAAIRYVGRIAADKHNLAFGIGTLQSLENGIEGENTAIGHYTLLNNTQGMENTAIGEKALSYNTTGSANTAVGFKSLFKAGDGGNKTDENTSLGFSSLGALTTGSGNTSVGSQALGLSVTGSNNVALGYASLYNGKNISSNVAVGSNSCSSLISGNYNICIGNRAGINATNSNYGLYIGSSMEVDDNKIGDNDTPLISGITQKNGSYDKQLSINAKDFYVRPFNGSDPILQITSISGTDIKNPYGDAKTGLIGLLYFDALGGGDTATFSITGKRSNDAKTPHNRIILGAYNKATTTDNSIDFSFNERLSLIFPKQGDTSNSFCDGDVCINTITPYKNLGINKKLNIQNETNTPTISLNQAGLSLEPSNNTNYGVTFKNASGGSIKFDTASNSMTISNGNKNVILSAEGNGTLSSDNFTLKNDDVYFNLLNGVSAKVYSPWGGYNVKLTGHLQNDIPKIYENLSQAITNAMTYGSDERLKNISGNSTAGLKEINALEIKNYTYKADEEKIPHVGVIAQQLQKIFPNSVFKGEDGYLKIRTEEIFFAMVNSIKELFAQLQDLSAKVTGLDKKITELEKQNAQLHKQNAEFEKRLSKLEKAAK